MRVSRAAGDGPTCKTHGAVSDWIEIGTSFAMCVQCAAAASGYKPWFYTSSPFWLEISALPCDRLGIPT